MTARFFLKMIIVDANNWFRMKLYSTTFLGVRDVIMELIGLKPDVLVWDGFQANERRRAYFPEYKRNRKERDLDTDFKFLNLIRKARVYLPITSFDADNCEADDVIAWLCGNEPDVTHTILSTDKDLCAIPNAVNPLVKKELCERRWVHLYKTLVGDKSDGIGGLSRFGEAGFRKLAEYEKELIKYSLICGRLLDGVPMKERLEKEWDNLLAFWEITDFMPVPLERLHGVIANPYNERELFGFLDKEGVL